MNLEWDEKKNAANLLKHGLSFQEIVRFNWEMARLYTDDRKDYGEDRIEARGFVGDRLHIVVFVLRGDRTRLISFRKANRRERAEHERETGK